MGLAINYAQLTISLWLFLLAIIVAIKLTSCQLTQQNVSLTKSAQPNYLETGRQITGILDKFMSLGYDKRVRPNYGGPPVEVNVTMRILSISSVSEVMMDFTADFYFRQTWHDPRLSFKKLGDIQTLYVGAEVSKKIWLPDTFFGNEKLAYFHEATTPNVFLRIDHSGEVYRSIRLTVTSSCPMNLQYFPMDRQRCTIEAESYGYNVKDIIYRWARKDTAVERDKEISLPQFDIVKTVQKYRLEELSSGTYSRLIAEIHFARRMGYYLIQIYIPSSLIVVISWVSFWLHRNASPARVQLGVTTVLTMTTLMSSTNAALPKISYVKSIDIFLGTCFIMVFAALLEYATVGYLGKRIAMRKAHLQHAQSQAQAKLFAQLQAQGAQGDPIPPMAGTSDLLAAQQQQTSPLLLNQVANQDQPVPSSQEALLVQQLAALASKAQQLEGQPAHQQQQQAPQVPERRQHYKCCLTAASQQASRCLHGLLLQQQQQQQEPCCCSAAHSNPKASQQNLNQWVGQHHCHQHQGSSASNTLPRNFAACKQHPCQQTYLSAETEFEKKSMHQAHQINFGDSNSPFTPMSKDNHNANHFSYNQASSQPCSHASPSSFHQQSGTIPGSKGAQAAAAAAAATFVNLHRKTRGLPPSTNPNFAQFAWMGHGYNRSLETIFGVRPSDIDKYSRVVFPVCFVCFQLMYWIVYLHISAFLESEQQKQQPTS